MVLTAAFNGAGDTRTPTLINLVSLWILEIPLAWVLAHPLGFGPTGAFIALSVGFSTLCFPERVDLQQGPLEDPARLSGAEERQPDVRSRTAHGCGWRAAISVTTLQTYWTKGYSEASASRSTSPCAG